MTNLKFLVASDFHSNDKITKNIEKKVKLDEIDFVLLVGDLSDKPNDFGTLLKPFKNKKVIMVPGNHESKAKVKILEEHYKVHMLGNKPVHINENLVLFGTNYMSIGRAGVPEDFVFQNTIENFKAIEHIPCKIQLNHIPPAGTQMGDASPFFPFVSGSSALTEFLEHYSPDVTFCGHIHETSGLEEIVGKTRVINVAETFKVFEFDEKNKEIKEIAI